MSIELREEDGGKIITVRVSGKLEVEDYERFVPEFERLAWPHRNLRLLFEMSAFHGWEAGAAWEDLKFGVKHLADIERLAVVGETKWQQGMAMFVKPFTTAAVRYFDHAEATGARAWLAEA